MFLVLALLLAAQTPAQSVRLSGAITGSLQRMDGAPAANVRVMAMDADDSSSDRSLAGVAVTDSAGRYQLGGLAPGRYIIAAGALTAPTYFPGITVRKEAGVVTVTGGAVASGIDFRMLEVPPSDVSGRIIREEGRPAAEGLIWLVPGEFIGNGFPFTEPVGSRFGNPATVAPRNTGIRDDGSFQFPATPPGNYFLILKGMERPLVLAGGRLSSIVVEGRDVTGLQMRIPGIAYVVQSIRVEDGSPVPPFDLVLADPEVKTTTRIIRKGLPSLAGALYEGDYRIFPASLPASHFVKSITSGGVDLSTEPLRVRSGSSAMEFSIVLGVTPR